MVNCGEERNHYMHLTSWTQVYVYNVSRKFVLYPACEEMESNKYHFNIFLSLGGTTHLTRSWLQHAGDLIKSLHNWWSELEPETGSVQQFLGGGDAEKMIESKWNLESKGKLTFLAIFPHSTWKPYNKNSDAGILFGICVNGSYTCILRKKLQASLWLSMQSNNPISAEKK